MALTSGDGPNRGASAPRPGRAKPKPGGASDRLSKQFTSEIAARNARDTRSRGSGGPAKNTPGPVKQLPLPTVTGMRSRTPDRFTYPILGGLFGKDEKGFDLPDKKEPLKVDIGPKRELDQDDLDRATAEVWGNLENEGAAGVMKRKAGGSTADPSQQRQQIVQNVADQYNVKARLGQRDQARIDREKKDRVETETVLTPAQWNKLSPLQQAAAQANADLADAIARDFKDQSKHDSDPAQFKRETDRVIELFGENGSVGFKGLEYAPNTLAFLDSRGLDKAALGGRTLDDIVSGDALIDDDTFASLGEKAGTDSRGKNLAFAQRLAAGQLQYQEDLAARLAKGDQLLSDITGQDTNNTAAGRYGGKLAPQRTVLDKVRPETKERIDTYMEILSRSDSPIDKALKVIKADLSELGASTEESAQVWEAMIERSRQATTGEGKWFEGVDFPMRSPVEVAQALGAPALKRRGKL